MTQVKACTNLRQFNAIVQNMQTRFDLTQADIPKQWYNLAADLPTPLQPPLGPDGKPVNPDMLKPVFPTNLIEQEVSHGRPPSGAARGRRPTSSTT